MKRTRAIHSPIDRSGAPGSGPWYWGAWTAAALGIGLGVAGSARAATLDVCGSCGFTTIAAAIAAAQANAEPDTIRIAQGTYPEGHPVISPNISQHDTITLEGGWDSAFTARTIDPDNTVVDAAGQGNVFWIGAYDGGETIDVTLDGLSVTNTAASGIPAIYAQGSGGTALLTLKRCRLHGNANAVGFQMQSLTILDSVIENNSGTGVLGLALVTLRRNVIRANGNRGVFLQGVSTAILENNVIAGNTTTGSGAGVYLDNCAGGGALTLVNDTIAGNTSASGGGGGFYANCTAATAITLTNDIIRGNGAPMAAADVWAQNAGLTVTASFSDLGQVAADGGATYVDGGGNIDADPLFVSPGAGDYHLGPGSPCIDTGTGAGAPADDFENDPRPIDGDGDTIAATDVGADERVPPTPTPTATPTATPTCTPAVPPVGPTPTPGDPEGGRACRRAIAKEAAKLAQARSKILAKCEIAKVKNAHSDPCPDPGGAEGNPGRKAADQIAKAVSKLRAQLDKRCGGTDQACNGDASEETPAALGFPSACPNFESSAAPECSAPILHCGDVADCLACIDEVAVDQAIGLYFGALSPSDPETQSPLNKCQQTIGKETQGFLAAKSKALQKCWDKRLKLLHVDPCPDDSAPAGTPARKAADAIGKAESKKVAKICAVCGGADGGCDQTIETGVIVGYPSGIVLPGTGNADDLPPAAIGFADQCPDLRLVEAPATSCGALDDLDGASDQIDSLRELILCVDCVTALKVDCMDRASVAGVAAYPACECNP